MKISALASLLGVAATTFLPGVAASEVVSAPDISFMSDFVLLYVGLCVMERQSIDNMMMPAEVVYTIWTPERHAPSDCMKALGSPPHR